MKDQTVILLRRFFPAAPQRGDWEFLNPVAGGTPQHWRALENLNRVLILAEPGAGKTFEARHQARKLSEKGKKAFFIRIEKLNNTFDTAFEIGTAEAFESWLASTEEAWFFLDSVDEAQLETPRAFEDAIRIFGSRIRMARERAHVYITSREDAWQALPDRSLIEQHLPYVDKDALKKEDVPSGEPAPKREPESALKVFRLGPLKRDEIRLFASYYSVGDIEAFLDAIERADLMSLAEKPFDLRSLIEKWQADRQLDNRRDVLQRVIELQIKPLSFHGSTIRIPEDRVRDGLRALAAAATLTGKSVISLPGELVTVDRIDPSVVLPDWSEEEIAALLKTGVFDDIVYGSVRFRHRDMRELLSAEWAASIAVQPQGRERIQNLFFRNSYGEKVIVPRLRPTLAWLILFDDRIRDEALAISPEIATEGGDPSRLPLDIKRRMLLDIVRRIAADDETGPWMDNAAITRIATNELSAETEELLARYKDNNDAIFFLARFVWQGKVKAGVPILAEIALDRSRDVHTQIAAIRAVMAVAEEAEKDSLVAGLLASTEPLDRQVASEIILNLPATLTSVGSVLRAIERTQPKRRFEITGLSQALHEFVDGLPVMADSVPEQPLLALIVGFDELLGREPHIERGECIVSSQYSWLLPSALRAVERLVGAKSASALDGRSIGILTKAQAAKFWDHDSDDQDKSRLREVVPRWKDLNDALYWQNVEERRARQQSRGGELTDDWQLTMYERYWAFSADDFDRCLSWVSTRENPDDRRIALSRCFALYLENSKRGDWTRKLIEAVAGQPALKAQLDLWLHPPAREVADWEIEHRSFERRHARRERKSARDRAAWISELKKNPDRIRNPSGAEPGQITGDHYHLMMSIEGEGGWTRYDARSNWQSLVPEFGSEVAEAFRDAAIKHWRHYDPKLQSEGADGSSIPHALIFALIGLEIESTEDGSFGVGLSEEEAAHAFRYIAWELNGFPRWFEGLYRAHHEQGLAAVTKELLWELAEASKRPGFHHILSDIDNRAPWLQADIAPILVEWLLTGRPVTSDTLRHSLKILQDVQWEGLADLAKARLNSGDSDNRPRWYALWVAYDPEAAIPVLQAELEALGDLASEFAQNFAVSLMGTRFGGNAMSSGYRSAAHLKTLYVLMHRFIRAEDDIERAGTGVYSPTLRDNAQDARNKLFNLLAEMPGEETYLALKQLAKEHPEEKYRLWMADRARQRAISDAEEPLWNVDQIPRFYRGDA